MLTTLILVFVVAYTAIALEHPLKVNKGSIAEVFDAGQAHSMPTVFQETRLFRYRSCL